MAPPKGFVPWNKGTSKGWINARGYREIRADGQTVKEHRRLVEQQLGRKLLPTEDVHHVNGVKTDNRLENLQVIEHGAHTSLTSSGNQYTRGRKLNLSDAERTRRSEHMKALHRAGIVVPPQFRALGAQP